MLRLTLSCSWLCLLWFACSGCACVQSVPAGNCGTAACRGGLGSGVLLDLIACRGGCGEIYVDEWVNEPPTPDQCGFPCGGCGHCVQCQPVRNALRLLWGRPYVGACHSDVCGTGCDGGCSSCDAGYSGETYVDEGYHVTAGSSHKGCNCGGGHHSTHGAPMHIPSRMNGEIIEEVPAAPSKTAPTPAPEIAPSSAKRLNPAARRMSVRTASTR